MGFVHFGENGWLVDKNGEPFYLTGINYIASYVCTDFFSDFREEILEKDLAKIEEMGLNAVRVPVNWGNAEPAEGIFNEQYFVNFSRFLEMARKHNLYVMPWMLVGVATPHFDIPWRQGRPMLEGHMLRAAENHLRQFARRYKDEENLLFWDVCDEPEWYSGFPGAEKLPWEGGKFEHWLGHMYTAIRKEDPNHLITCGVGEIASERYGYTLKGVAAEVDFMGTTGYPIDSAVEGLDTARNNSYMAFYLKMNAIQDKPVLALEAPGYSTVMYSEEMLGRYFKVSVYSNLVNGGTGVMPWAYNDFSEELWMTPNLDPMPGEPSFGIISNDGRVKPSGEALIEYGKFVRDAKITDYQLRKPKVAVYLSDDYYGRIYYAKRKIRAAMAFVKGCGADMKYVWSDDDWTGIDLLIIPYTGLMRTSAWKRIADFVEQGGKVLFDYDCDYGLSVFTNRLFGVEVQTKHKNHKFNSISLRSPMGQLQPGQEFVFTEKAHSEIFSVGQFGFSIMHGRAICSEYLKVKATTAQVMATFADGTPALLRNRYGKGQAWFFTGQFHSEMFEMPYEDFQSHMMFNLYNAIFQEEGITRPCTYVNAELETGLFEKENGEKLLLLINHSPEENEVRLALSEELKAMQCRLWEERDGITLENGTLSMTMEAAEVVKLVFNP